MTTTADYLAYALSQPETRVIGLVLETLRDAPGLRACLAEAAERDIPVVALTVGGSARGQVLVDAHSGAIAGSDAGWEALFAAYGVHRADDLGELTDSLECFAIGRRVRRPGGGIATVHDSGAERVLAADVAERLGVPFAPLSEATVDRLSSLLDPGLEPTNPLDVWGTGNGAEDQLSESLAALADDDAVDVVALAVDLVPEFDGDESFPKAIGRLVEHTDKPVVVLSNLSSAIDQPLAAQLRSRGVPVLEGTRSGLRALGHLRDQATRPRVPDAVIDEERRARWLTRFESGDVDPFGLLADYGIPVAASWKVDEAKSAVAAAETLGYPVVLKTAAPDVLHNLDVDGVRLGLGDVVAVRAAYHEIADRLRAVGRRPAPGGARHRGGPRCLARPAPRPPRPDRGRRLARGAAGGTLRRPPAGGRFDRPGAGLSPPAGGAARRPSRPTRRGRRRPGRCGGRVLHAGARARRPARGGRPQPTGRRAGRRDRGGRVGAAPRTG